jgi:hypothetical protein
MMMYGFANVKFIRLYLDVNNSNCLLQRWGNLTQLSQSIVFYLLVLINAFVFCWFGSVLSAQESIVMSNWVT